MIEGSLFPTNNETVDSSKNGRWRLNPLGEGCGEQDFCMMRKSYSFDPWIGKTPWRRAQQAPLVFLPGESHGWRSMVGYSPQGHKQLDTTGAT